jgi:thioesterase domain-containing protein
MDSDDIAGLSENKRLLLEALLKKRIEADTEEPSWQHHDQAHDPRNSGRAGTNYGHGHGHGHGHDHGHDHDHDHAHESQRRGGASARDFLRDTIFSNPLLRKARELLERASAEQEMPTDEGQIHESPLICMRAEGDKTPFFCVHALLGSTFHYFALANLLDKDQPFYALQAPGLDGVQQPLKRISEFASYYIEYIREVQPKGPYKIGGYSFGGLVAFEIARQLTLSGEAVSRLIIFGTDVPISISNPKMFKTLEFFSQYYADFYKNMVKPFFSYEKRVNWNDGWNDGAKKLPFSPVLVRIALAHCQAAFRYHPSPFPGKITLFETLEQQVMSPTDPSRGWDQLASVGVETQMISGNHLSMLDEPHIYDLAEKLNWCLRQT